MCINMPTWDDPKWANINVLRGAIRGNRVIFS